MKYQSLVCGCVLWMFGMTAQAADPPVPASVPGERTPLVQHAGAAHAVMDYIQDKFYLPEKGLYARSLTDRQADFMWGDGVLFSALVGAARNDPAAYRASMNHLFHQLDRYWDRNEKVPGYEPSETNGNGHDKYFDDNAWMVLTFTEAYAVTSDRAYLQRAEQTLNFVLSGWDDQLGGGIWWHETHKADSKNTCINAPAAVCCLRIARYQPADAEKLIQTAERIVDWTTKTFRADDGLFKDSIKVSTGQMNPAKLTYNTALMIRAYLGLYRATGDEEYLREAKRSAAAADWFVDQKTQAYRDPLKWSHLLVEADLEMYRATGDPHLLQRAKDATDAAYAQWKIKPPPTLIDNAALARMLWLFADLESDSGRQFWQKFDQPIVSANGTNSAARP